MSDVQVRLAEFSELIDGYTADFVGRTWLVEQVVDLLDDPDCRFVVLTGGAGVGRDAFQPVTGGLPQVVFASGAHKD